MMDFLAATGSPIVSPTTFVRRTFMRAILGSVAVTMALATSVALAQGLITKKRLSAALAHEAVAEAVTVCAKAGYAVTAIVVDNEGVRQAVLRGDGATVHTLDSAYAK